MTNLVCLPPSMHDLNIWDPRWWKSYLQFLCQGAKYSSHFGGGAAGACLLKLWKCIFTYVRIVCRLYGKVSCSSTYCFDTKSYYFFLIFLIGNLLHLTHYLFKHAKLPRAAWVDRIDGAGAFGEWCDKANLQFLGTN